MFPLVAPPHRGGRGLDEYREAMAPFFEWLASGGIMEQDELTVVVGSDLAFAFGLARCGTPAELAAEPDARLRFTVGLRKVDGSWEITHEHVSTANPIDPPIRT